MIHSGKRTVAYGAWCYMERGYKKAERYWSNEKVKHGFALCFCAHQLPAAENDAYSWFSDLVSGRNIYGVSHTSCCHSAHWHTQKNNRSPRLLLPLLLFSTSPSFIARLLLFSWLFTTKPRTCCSCIIHKIVKLLERRKALVAKTRYIKPLGRLRSPVLSYCFLVCCCCRN